MEFLKIVRRRTFLSEAIYIALNIALALAVVFAIRITGSIVPAIVLILLSKWRILAVRPRYWFANIQSNLVDLIVGLSVAILLNSAYNADTTDTQKLITLAILTVLYVGWLLFLKPRSKRGYIVAQAGVALFVGVTALFTISYEWPVSLVVIGMWLIGYATARHVLSHYDEEAHILFLSLIWGLSLAEIGWPAYHSAIAYPIIGNILIPQISIIVLCIGFVVYRAYDSYVHYQKIRRNDILLPLLFTICIAAAILIIVPLLRCNALACFQV